MIAPPISKVLLVFILVEEMVSLIEGRHMVGVCIHSELEERPVFPSGFAPLQTQLLN